MSLFEVQAIATKVRELAITSPLNVYNESKCFYTMGTCDNGSTGCIVGQAISALFPDTIPALHAIDTANPQSVLTAASCILALFPIPNYGEVKEVHPINQMLNWLDQVQRSQDNNLTWISAIEIADSRGYSL